MLSLPKLMGNSSCSSANSQEYRLYGEWMRLQEQELEELLNHQTLNPAGDHSAKLGALLEKTIRNFEDYSEQRRRLARRDVSAFFSPSWCSTLENSMFWVAGCRPSSYFNLVYALCGSDIESKLSRFLQGSDGASNSSGFPHLSASQLSAIDKLQRRTISEEEKLSRKVASLQQEMGDMPLALIARQSGQRIEFNSDVKDAIGRIEEAMVGVMEEADQLRLSTVKELMIGLLTSVQALEFIVAAKKLRLCFRAWAMERDREHGRARDS